MDDKLRLDNSGKINKDLLKKLKSYFSRVELYLNNVPQYKWLSKKRIKHMIAYNHSFQGTHSRIEETLNKNGIKIISAKKMLRKINSYLKETNNIKVQDQMLRTIQLLNWNGKIEI